MSIDLSAKPAQVLVQPYSPLTDKFSANLSSTLVSPLESYINAMLTGLHINRNCSVVVQPVTGRRDPLKPVRVLIDGIRCVQPITTYSASPKKYLDSLPSEIEQIVCQNRSLFVSERLVRDYRRAWGASQEIDDFLFSLLRRLVHQGFSLNRAKLWLDSGGNAETDVDAAFDDATGDEPMAVYVYLPEDWRQDRDGLASDLARCFTELGIGSIGLFLQFEAMPSDWAFRVKINDLMLPATRKRELTKSNRVSRDGLLGAIGATLERSLSCLITTGLVDAQLNAVGKRYPALEQEVRQRFSLHTLAEILQGLAEAGVPIYDVRTVFESLVLANGRTVAGKQMTRIVLLPETANFSQLVEPAKTKDLSVRELNQIVRTALTRHIGAKYSKDKQLAAILLDPDVETYFTGDEYRRLDGHQLRQLYKDLNQQLIDWSVQNPQLTSLVVLLVTPEVHTEVQATFREAFPGVPILGYFELPGDININQAGRLELVALPWHFVRLHEAIEARDEAIDEETQRELEDKGEDFPLLAGLVSYTAFLKKLEVRLDELSKADDDLREFLTQDIEILEDEISSQEFVDDRPDDLTDMISDFFKF